MNLFECKVTHVDKSTSKKITETYIVDAMSFVEAETILNKEIGEYYKEADFKVSSVRTVHIADVVGKDKDAEKWYKAKVCFVYVNEVTGKEEKSNSMILVHSDDIEEALKDLVKFLNDSVSDNEILSVTNTPIVDIINFSNSDVI